MVFCVVVWWCLVDERLNHQLLAKRGSCFCNNELNLFPLHRFPTFMKPYLVCLHSSPITCSSHSHNCPTSLFQQIEKAGTKQLESDFSQEVRCGKFQVLVTWSKAGLETQTGKNSVLICGFCVELANWACETFLSYLDYGVARRYPYSSQHSLPALILVFFQDQTTG